MLNRKIIRRLLKLNSLNMKKKLVIINDAISIMRRFNIYGVTHLYARSYLAHFFLVAL
jgi:hypothetical protein